MWCAAAQRRSEALVRALFAGLKTRLRARRAESGAAVAPDPGNRAPEAAPVPVGPGRLLGPGAAAERRPKLF